ISSASSWPPSCRSCTAISKRTRFSSSTRNSFARGASGDRPSWWIRVRFHGEESFILVHVEHQGRRKSDTARRLFLYAAWLMDRYSLPVYPVLVTSYDRPHSLEPDRFVMEVRGLQVLDFRFRVVQLNRLNWRDYVRLKKPAA